MPTAKATFPTPIALVIFNRPDLTKRVFQSIAQVRPRQLFVVCDGPRPNVPGEAALVAASRAVLEKVDWPCELLTNYSQTNLGCKRRVATGLDWIFQMVEEAIILEDDCIPDPTFYTFCEQLLERFRNDDRIAAISGNNFQNGRSRTPHSYYFSKYFHCWGWASWRRVWKTFDADMQSWPAFRQSRGLRKWRNSVGEEAYWEQIFDATFNGKIDSWAYGWLYNCWRHDGLTILPDVNLVSNIGFRADATHTRNGDGRFANLPTVPIGRLDHPREISCNIEADKHTFAQNFRPAKRWKQIRNQWKFQLKWNLRQWLDRAA